MFVVVLYCLMHTFPSWVASVICVCVFLWYLFHVGFCVVFWVVVDHFGWVVLFRFVLCCVVLSCVML